MDKRNVRRYVLLLAVCGIVFAANYAQYQVSGLAHLVVPRLGLTSAQFSAVLLAPFLPAIVLGVPIGVCADRYGVRRLVFVSAIASCVFAAARAACSSFAILFGASMLLGFAPCVVNATALKVLGAVFGEETDRAMGWFYAAGSAGIAASLATSSLFGSELAAYGFAAALFAVFGLLWLAVAPHRAELRAAAAVEGAEASAGGREALGAVVKMPMVWLVACLLGVALASATSYSGYLVSALEGFVDPQAAGSLASFVTLGSIAGSVVGPHLRARFADYRVFLALAALVGGALMWAGELTVSSPSVVLMLGIGVFTAVAGPVVQALPYQLPEVRGALAGSAGGLVSTVSLGLTFVIPVVLSVAVGESYEALLVGCAVLFAVTALVSPLLPGPDRLA